MKTIFALLAAFLIDGCLDFRDTDYTFDFNKKTIHIDYASPFCSSCIDSSLTESAPEGLEKEYSAFSQDDIKYYNSLLRLDAFLHGSDSLYFPHIFKSTIGNISYSLIGKNVFKKNDDLHIVLDIKIRVNWFGEAETKAHIIKDITEASIFGNKSELLLIEDSSRVFNTNSDQIVKTNKNTIYAWDAHDSIIKIRMVKDKINSKKELTFEKFFDNKGYFLKQKVPPIFLKNYNPNKLLTELFKDQ